MARDLPLLSDDELATALAGLPAWSRDGERIRRAVTCGVRTPTELLAAVAGAETALDHHAVTSTNGDTLTFELWTHSEGGLTRLDVELAHRIDEAVVRIT